MNSDVMIDVIIVMGIRIFVFSALAMLLLCYGSSPGVSVFRKMKRVVYSQHSRS